LVVANDTVHLENAIFTALAAAPLTSTAFVKKTTGVAQDTSDRIIYDSDSGLLRYDRDGTGAAKVINFAAAEEPGHHLCRLRGDPRRPHRICSSRGPARPD